ncbi:MAG: site-specific integrase [bacterium]|nr:site-specific integrase [bacterium]
MPSFAEATDAVIAIYRTGWKPGGRTEQKWRTTLRDYAFPTLGAKPVDKIKTADVMAVLVPIWHEKPVLARTLKQRIGAIMRWAVCQGFRADNPAGDAIAAGLPKQNGHTNHHRAVPHNQVASVINEVRRSAALPTTRACFEFLVLTAARTSEARLARWSEVDMEGSVWTIPGERMKSGRVHRVPLSVRTLEVLEEAHRWKNGGDLVFPSRTGRPLGHSTLLHLMRRLRIDATPHGMRSSFRIWVEECTDAPRTVSEAALAHVNRNQVEAAYLRSDLFDRRRVLMNQWAAYVTTATA